jgi:hypothetical protein
MANRYWIGGSGDWTDRAHWSDASGGSSYTVGSEIITNGSFTGSATGWTLSGNYSYSSNQIVCNGNGSVLQTALGTSASETYLVSVDITYTSGSADITLSGRGQAIPNSTGTHTFLAKPFNTNDDIRILSSNFVGTIDNISVKQVTFLYTVPTFSDDVFLDENSGLSGAEIRLTGSYDTAGCRNITCTSGETYSIAYITSDFSIYGDAILEAGLTFDPDYGTYLYLDGTTGDHSFRTNGATLNYIELRGNGNFIFEDDMKVADEFKPSTGTFDPGAHTIEFITPHSGISVGGVTFYNVYFSTPWVTGATNYINDSNTFNQLKMAPGVKIEIEGSSTQTVSDFDATGTATNAITVDKWDISTGPISTGSFVNAGKNYSVGDVLTVSGGGSNATIRVDSIGPTYGSELITNGSFTGNANGWTLNTGWAYDSNNVVHSSGTGMLEQSIVYAGTSTTYLVSFDISNYVSGNFTVWYNRNTTTGVTYSGDGTKTFSVTLNLTGSTYFGIVPSTNFVGNIDNISVKQVTRVAGAIITSTLTNPGTGYTVNTNYNITGGTGSSALYRIGTVVQFPFTLSKSSGVVSCDYLNLSNSTATGGATWYAGSNSVDNGGNTGWIFTDRPQFTLSYTAGSNGTIVGDSSQTVYGNENGTLVTATPNTSYAFAGWSDGLMTPSRQELNVTNNLDVTASFTKADPFPNTSHLGAGSAPTNQRDIYFKRNLQTIPKKKKEIDRLKFEYIKKII